MMGAHFVDAGEDISPIKQADVAFWSEDAQASPANCDMSDVASVEEDVLHLHAHLSRKLCRHVVSLGLNVSEAEDVIQESFLELFRHLVARRSCQNLPAWLFRVTHRMAIKRRHKQRARHFMDDQTEADLLPALTFNPEEEAILNERQRKLRKIFLALPESDRLCLQLRSEGLNYREIAATLQISLGSVHNALARSFNRLKSCN